MHLLGDVVTAGLVFDDMSFVVTDGLVGPTRPADFTAGGDDAIADDDHRIIPVHRLDTLLNVFNVILHDQERKALANQFLARFAEEAAEGIVDEAYRPVW